MKPPATFGALFLLLLSGGCTFDFVTRDRFMDCDLQGTTLKVSADHVENSIDLKPYISSSGPCEMRVLFPGRHEGLDYLLLDVTSQSSADSTGPCARGTEENLIWLKLDSNLQVQDTKSVLVESCLQNIHGRHAYDQSDNGLMIKYVRTEVATEGADMHTRQYESELSYDNDHPEAGMIVKTNEVK
jgi:hypothetical protein